MYGLGRLAIVSVTRITAPCRCSAEVYAFQTKGPGAARISTSPGTNGQSP